MASVTLLQQIVAHTWVLFLEAAPWLLVGLVVAGLLKAWVDERRMADWLGGEGLWPATKAALIGAPLPLCSCGVIPAAMGLRRAGASRASTTAFLIATPETGADSVGISYALLGPFMMVVRPVAAVASAVITALATGFAPATRARAAGASDTPKACCAASDDSQPRADNAQRTARDCRGPAACQNESAASFGASFWARTRAGLRYAATDIIDDFKVWLAIGLVVAGIAITLVPPTALAQYGAGLPAMLVMLIIGVPVYVCATESTPIAAAMLVAGVSPGVVLVFLLAGPATNIATLGVLYKEFGGRLIAIYLAGIAVCALGFGLLTDAVVAWLNLDIAAHLHAGSQVVPGWLALACALVVLVLAIPPLRTPLLRRL